MPDRLGCRVLDKDGNEETPYAWDADGMPEHKALAWAQHLAGVLPDYAPYTVVDADGATLHTIHAEAK